MKRTLLTCMAGATLFSAQAQLFSPEALNGALWGSLIGGVVGGDCYNGFSGEAAAIGAGVGLLAGAIAGEARRNDFDSAPRYVSIPAPAVNIGYGYGSCGSSAYVYYAPGYYYRATRPNYAVSGTVLGAASGALIGTGYDDAGKGAAIGAAAGLVLGSVTELSARKANSTTPTQVAVANPNQNVAATTETAESQPVIQPPRCEITSQPCATSTYTWTPRPQIADASRGPAGPTF